jgi:predicted GIY-YIG superfamily endonuclease
MTLQLISGRALRVVSQGRQGAANSDKVEIESNGAPVYYTYILRCADGSFCVGSTQNLASRIKNSQRWPGAAYTFKHRPVQLVYSEVQVSVIDTALRSRKKK